MTFAIAAAGTGGHVYPGLAVGEALVARGIERSDVLYVGGGRLEARVYPEQGFPFLSVELRGLERRVTLANLALPWVVGRAVGTLRSEFRRRGVRAALGLGSYVTVPAGVAARLAGAELAVAEQNAEAGLANRLMARLSRRVFGAFPVTHGLERAEWVGNPIRPSLSRFDRASLRPSALARWGLDPAVPVVGVFGGSLGAGAINQGVVTMMARWSGPPLQVVHLAGQGFPQVSAAAEVSGHRWVVLDFCEDMAAFFAVSDLVVARAGGSVAELTATATPSVLVPGGFGSSGHQAANAAVLQEAGAAVVLPEEDVEELASVVASLLEDVSRRRQMAAAASRLARPQAADAIAEALVELAGR